MYLSFSLPYRVYRSRPGVCHEGANLCRAKRLISTPVAKSDQREKDEHPRETPFGAPCPPHRGVEALARRRGVRGDLGGGEANGGWPEPFSSHFPRVGHSTGWGGGWDRGRGRL